MPKIQINNQVLGGLSDSKYLGIANSVAKIIGFNLHGEPGILKVNQKMTKISASLIDGLIKASVPCSNGETYFFSGDSGKIWRVKSDNSTVELCYTTSAGAGESKCLGATEYKGYIYWGTELRLHRIPIANAKSESSWTTVTLNWQTFTKGDKDYHPFQIQNDVLYIGDGNQIAQVDNETFSASVMNKWPDEHRVSALQNYVTSLLFGTIVSSNVVNSIVASWNTWSTNISFKDELPEAGINSFLKTDNFVIGQCGKKGNFYIFNGSQMEQYKRIPGDWSGSNQAIVYPDANANVNGMPFFGVSNISGNPTEQGVYSFGSYSKEYPKVLNLEYIISTGHTSNIEIGSIVMAGTDMFVSWKDSTSTPVFGIDKIDTANKYNGAYLDTRIIQLNRKDKKDIGVNIYYRSLPTGTDITLQASVNYGTFQNIELLNDTDRKFKFTKIKIRANCIQFRIITSASVNNAPEVDLIEIYYN